MTIILKKFVFSSKYSREWTYNPEKFVKFFHRKLFFRTLHFFPFCFCCIVDSSCIRFSRNLLCSICISSLFVHLILYERVPRHLLYLYERRFTKPHKRIKQAWFVLWLIYKNSNVLSASRFINKNNAVHAHNIFTARIIIVIAMIIITLKTALN